MNLLLKLLNFQKRHFSQGYRYARGGVANRILNILFITIITLGALALEYFTLAMLFGDNALLGILLVIPTIALLFASVELGIVYAYFGFKSAVAGGLDSWLKKAEFSKKQNVVETVSSNGEELQISDAQPTTAKRKCPIWLDIVSAVYFVLLTIALLVMAVIIFGML